MEPSRTFDSIWYREKPVTESTRADPFIRERGRLTVEGDALRFDSRKLNLVIRDVEAVEYGVYGSMTSPSIQVRYREGGEPRTAWFTDGRLGGYSGMFGGTRQLAQAMSHLGATSFDDAGAGRAQKALALALLGLVVWFINRVFL